MEDNLRQVVVRAVYTPADINWEFGIRARSFNEIELHLTSRASYITKYVAIEWARDKQ